jgi:trans-2,3-dihydro-3-hydroxyanthranilate isomerase
MPTGTMRRLPYEICDVFTDRPLAGNALAVFTDGTGLDEATMQALARETNLSETTFVLPPTVPDADARIRIFTPRMEMPFAGHPTLGSAFVVAGRTTKDVIRLETGMGVIPVELTRKEGVPAFGWMTQPIPRVEPFLAAGELFAALDVIGSRLPLEVYDNGAHCVFVELESPDEVANLRPDLGRLAALGKLAFSVFARNGDRWKTRVFVPGKGVAEDPGTGSAAGSHATHLARHGRTRFGEEIIIEQGVEIGRPSRLYARVTGSADAVASVRVGGAAIVVGGGELRIQ